MAGAFSLSHPLLAVDLGHISVRSAASSSVAAATAAIAMRNIGAARSSMTCTDHVASDVADSDVGVADAHDEGTDGLALLTLSRMHYAWRVSLDALRIVSFASAKQYLENVGDEAISR